MVSVSTKWSLSAGIYTFLCSTVLLLGLSPLSDTLVELLALPAEYSVFVLAAPAPFLGAIAWWAAVERRGTYTYPSGAIYGLSTALATMSFWVLVFASVWGVSLVWTGRLLVAFVAAVSLPVALLAGLVLVGARRRLKSAVRPRRDGALQ